MSREPRSPRLEHALPHIGSSALTGACADAGQEVAGGPSYRSRLLAGSHGSGLDGSAPGLWGSADSDL